MNSHSKIVTDSEGFLLQPECWDKAFAIRAAEQEGIRLTEPQWEMIGLIRDFYQDNQTIPTFRGFITLVKEKLGNEKGKSLYLYQLFPGNPMKYLCKIAGLPKPKYCM